MTFEVGPDADHPELQGDGIQYEGLRFRAECRLAGKLYGQPFGVDVAFGDPIIGEPDIVVAEDVLAFAGIPPPTLRLYPVETHPNGEHRGATGVRCTSRGPHFGRRGAIPSTGRRTARAETR